MNDILLESLRTLVLLGLLVFLVFAGRRREQSEQRGWGLILLGFFLLFVGSMVDITDNFQSLNHFVVIGDTETQAFIEKLVGFLGGFLVLTIGLIRWIPTVQSIQETKSLALRLQARERERDHAVAKLQESEKKYRTLFEKSGDATLVIRQGLLVDANQAAIDMFGYSKKEQLFETHPGELSPEWQAGGRRSTKMANEMMALAQTRGNHRFEWQHQRRDGEVIPTEVLLTSVTLADGDFQHSVIRDITDRKKAETELDRMHQELLQVSRLAGMSEVATGVLHNVGNALNSITVGSGMAREHVRGFRGEELKRAGELLAEHEHDMADFVTVHPRGRHFARYIIEMGMHLEQQCQKTLSTLKSLDESVSHVKKIVAMQQACARVVGVLEETSLESLLENVLGMRATSHERHGIRLVCQFDDIPKIMVDRHKVMQIIDNLVENAKHAICASRSASGVMTLQILMTDEGFACIEVADNGIGISSENLSRIFNYGFTTKKDGHGFGLHVSALAAQEMGGRLTAQSEGENCGAVFSLYLPIDDSAGPLGSGAPEIKGPDEVS